MNSACAIIVHNTRIYKQLEHPAISSPFENHDGRGREITSQFLSGENLLALMVSDGEACSVLVSCEINDGKDRAFEPRGFVGSDGF